MSITWIITNGRLTHSELPEPVAAAVSEPFPPEWWYITEGAMTHSALPPPIASALEKPYPPGVWYIENGRLTHSALPSPPRSGAFCGCTSLRQVSIPESVKSIGEFAFADTALRKVKIARDCSYYPTSFPDGCVIEFYGGN